MPIEYKCPAETVGGSSIQEAPLHTNVLGCTVPTSNVSQGALISCCPAGSKVQSFKRGCYQYCAFSVKEPIHPITHCLNGLTLDQELPAWICKTKPDDVDPPYEPNDPEYKDHNASYRHLSNKASLILGLLMSALMVEILSA